MIWQKVTECIFLKHCTEKTSTQYKQPIKSLCTMIILYAENLESAKSFGPYQPARTAQADMSPRRLTWVDTFR